MCVNEGIGELVERTPSRLKGTNSAIIPRSHQQQYYGKYCEGWIGTTEDNGWLTGTQGEAQTINYFSWDHIMYIFDIVNIFIFL